MKIKLNCSDNFVDLMANAVALKKVNLDQQLKGEINGGFLRRGCAVFDAEASNQSSIEYLEELNKGNKNWIEQSINSRHLEDYFNGTTTEQFIAFALAEFSAVIPVFWKLLSNPVLLIFSSRQDGHNEVSKISVVRNLQDAADYNHVGGLKAPSGVITGLYDPNEIYSSLSGKNEIMIDL